MNKKTYTFAMLLFLIYLINANSIILSFFKDERLQKVDFSKIPSNSEVYYYIDNLEELGGLLECHYTQGWAYCETESDNTNKMISIILKNISDNQCYKIDTPAGVRPDVYGMFRDDKKIYNQMNGLECQFSSINIRNGIYELYLYVKENDINYGLTNTGLKYIKDDDGFRLKEDEQFQKVDFSKISSNSQVYYYIDSLEELDEYCYIQGWAYCETESDNTNKMISIILKNISNDQCYRIDNTVGVRTDVYNTFKNEKKVYNQMNGLECQFSSINIENGTYELYLYVKENDINYGLANTEVRFIKDSDEFHLEK